MEIIIGQLLAYLIGLAANLRSTDITEKHQRKLQDLLDSDLKTLFAINSRKSLVEQLEQIGSHVGQCMAELGIDDPSEQAIWQLTSDATFRRDLAEWLTLWDLDSVDSAKARLESRIVAALEQTGAEAERIELFRRDFFNSVDNLVFSDAKLSQWRLHLGLRALHENQAEILRRYRERDGEYGPERIQQAIDKYRELTLRTCDIIDLAGLPEGEQHLATQDFILRQLYIPLRARFEGSREGESADGFLESAESIRESTRLQVAGRARSNDDREEDSDDADDRKSVAEVLKSDKRIVVLGDPGSGKTTLMRWFATAYLLRLKADPGFNQIPDVASLPDADWLPILIQCRHLAEDADRSDIDAILTQARPLVDIPEALRKPLLVELRRRMENGTALVMIDGLDEIQNPTLRARFCRRLEAMATIYDKAPMLVTSRIVGYREMRSRLGRGFRHATISDLTPDEMDDFARRWIAATESKKQESDQKALAEKLIKDIHGNDRVERLAGNPMLLTTLALVHRRIGRLPQRRVDLYREGVQVLLNRRSIIGEALEWQEAVPQLEYIAYSMCSRGVQRLTKDDVLTLIEEMRQIYGDRLRDVGNRTPQEFLAFLEGSSSLLIEAGNIPSDGTEVPVYEFRHLTFQEFLAGLALVDGRFPGHKKGSRLADRVAGLAGEVEESRRSGFSEEGYIVSENWREPLRLCLTTCHDDDVDDALLAILEVRDKEIPEKLSRPRAIMAALCLADEPSVSRKVALKVLRTFTGLVSKGDASGDVRSALDAAAMEIGRSHWSAQLRRELVERFCKEIVDEFSEPGALCGMVGANDLPNEELAELGWIESCVASLTKGDHYLRVESALTLLLLAYQGKLVVVPDLTESLIDMLIEQSPGSSEAASWALQWMNGGNSLSTGRSVYWTPDESQITAIAGKMGKSDVNDFEVNSLLYILGRSDDSRAKEIIRSKLDDKSKDVRVTAVEALVESLELEDDRRRLLGRLDPKRIIDEDRVASHAKRLKITKAEVKQMYEELAPTFKLKLKWA